MQQGQDDAAEKSHEPSPRKLEEARRRGEVPRSADVAGAAAYGGLLLAFAAGGAWAVDRAGRALAELVGRADALAPLLFEGSARAPTGVLAGALAGPLALWLGLPGLAALAALIAQRAVTVTPSKLALQPGRISPVAGARNKFGRNGLFEFAKSTAKLVIFTLCLALFLADRLPRVLASLRGPPGPATAEMGRLMVEFLALVFVISAVLGAADFFWQRAEHRRRHRMSHKELRDETREAEGDPWLKQERRGRAEALATNRMLEEVPRADVVIVNPTHVAVALRWSREAGSAPVCVAKGVGEIAARIRERAAEAGVPVRRDPPTARALHATVALGAEIAPEHYRPVAAAIRFAEDMRARARARGRR